MIFARRTIDETLAFRGMTARMMRDPEKRERRIVRLREQIANDSRLLRLLESDYRRASQRSLLSAQSKPETTAGRGRMGEL